MQVVVSNPETGKTYQKEIEDKKVKALKGKKLGQEVEGTLLDMSGYTLQITGGSDKQGFPMRKGVNTPERKKLLMSGGTGYRQKKAGMRKRKTVRGEIVSEEIQQLNLKVKKKGKKGLAVVFGEEPEEVEETETKETEEAEEETQEEPEDEEPEEESEEDEEETQEEDYDYEGTLGNSIGDIKDEVEEFDKEQLKNLLEAEKNGKERKTLVEWIEKQLEEE